MKPIASNGRNQALGPRPEEAALFARPSRRMAAGTISLVAVLRDARKSALLRVGLNSNARKIGGSDALARGGKRFRRTQNPRLIEPSPASTRRRRAGALRFKPLKRLDFHFRSGSKGK